MKTDMSKKLKDADSGVKGWRKELKVRQKGRSKGRIDVYMYSPENVKFRSKKELKGFLEQTKSKIRIDDFNFCTPPAISVSSKSSATKKLSVKNDVQGIHTDKKTTSGSSKISATKKLGEKNDIQAINAAKTTSGSSKISATKKLREKNDIQAINAAKTTSGSSKISATKKLGEKNDIQAINAAKTLSKATKAIPHSPGNTRGTSSQLIRSTSRAAASGDASLNNVSATTDIYTPSTSGVKMPVKSLKISLLKNSVKSVKTVKGLKSSLQSSTKTPVKSSAKSSVKSSAKKNAMAALKPNGKSASKGNELSSTTRRGSVRNK